MIPKEKVRQCTTFVGYMLLVLPGEVRAALFFL